MKREQSNIMNMKEQNILTLALEKFSELTGISTQILNISPNGRRNFDAVIELEKGKQNCILEAEVKSEVRTASLDNIISRQELTDSKIIMIAKYIPTPMKEELRKRSICYLETSGNCYIETLSMFIFISDQKTTEPKHREDSKLWAPAGIKFLFAVLTDPQILNTSYRNMAYTSGVALGNIGHFISEMKRDNYILTGTRNGRAFLSLDNKTALINKWSDMYRTVLRPKQIVGRFRFSKKDDRQNWHKLISDYPDIYWGGETAGAILTGHLIPEIYTIYTNIDRFELIRNLKIIPDSNGEIEVLRPFWNENIITDIGETIPPMLAYAELHSSFDSRNREIAARIKEQYVK